MIDRRWERWTEIEIPRVEMFAKDYDPNCRGCCTEYRTEREYTSSHTCANPDRRRPFVPQPFDPRYTVVPVTSSQVRLLTLPQLPPTSGIWSARRSDLATPSVLPTCHLVPPHVAQRKPSTDEST